MRIALKEFINKIFNKIKWDLCNLQTVCKYKNFDLQLTTHNSLAKALAFTLAETLVVMGIIGVVAALTIPNLNQSTGDREKVAKLKKVYANLTDAFGRATAVYGPIDEWFINIPGGTEDVRLADRMTEFMKISKSCGYDGSGCFYDDDYKDLAGGTEVSPITWTDEPMYLLADGTAVDFYIYSIDCDDSEGQLQKEICGVIYVDIDGVKGSNTLGKDYFSFYVAKSGIYPDGAQILNDDSVNYGKDCFNRGAGCAGWIIEMGNMDYLKADSDGKCPNGTTLSVDNPTCK